MYSFFQLVGEKTKYALSVGIKVIACIGEKLEEREAGKTEEVVYRQMQAIVGEQCFPKVILAWSPVLEMNI